MHKAGVPPHQSAGLAATATVTSAAHAARWLTQLWSPVVVGLGLRAYRRGDREAALALAAAVLVRPAQVADDIAYGAGVWAGCLRTRSPRPLLPRPLSRF
jgi:hypothetical protein